MKALHGSLAHSSCLISPKTSENNHALKKIICQHICHIQIVISGIPAVSTYAPAGSMAREETTVW